MRWTAEEARCSAAKPCESDATDRKKIGSMRKSIPAHLSPHNISVNLAAEEGDGIGGLDPRTRFP